MSKFEQYEAFVAVVNTGSVSLAAESLNLTPSAISKQIANLELNLGVQLFDRSNRRMVSTKQGAQFFSTSVSILRQVQDAEDKVLQDKTEVSGEIKITLSKSLIGSEVAETLHLFSEQYPRIKYNLQFTESVESFGDSNLDFAFRIGHVSDHTRLISREINSVSPIFYATKEYLSRYGFPENISDLDKHCVALPPHESLSSDVRQWLKSNGYRYDSAQHHRVDDVSAIQDLVFRHGAIGFNLECSLLDHLTNERVVDVLPNVRSPLKKLHLVYRKSRYPSAHLETFKDFVLDRYC